MSAWQELGAATTGRLRKLLELARVSQTELGRRTGTNQSTANQFLNGRHPDWRVSTLVRMASGLRLDVAVLFIPQGQPYQWCGVQECPGLHYYDLEPNTRWCHGAPIR